MNKDFSIELLRDEMHSRPIHWRLLIKPQFQPILCIDKTAPSAITHLNRIYITCVLDVSAKENHVQVNYKNGDETSWKHRFNNSNNMHTQYSF